MKFTEYLRDKGACPDISEYEKYASAREAWEGSTSGSDLLWAVTILDSVRGARLAVELAKSVLKYVPEGEDRPAKAIEAAEGYLSGDVSRESLRAAAAAAADAADAADASAAYYAAYDAAYAAANAYSAAYEAAYDASYAAANAAAANAAAANAAAYAYAASDAAQWVRDRVNFSDLVDGLDIE